MPHTIQVCHTSVKWDSHNRTGFPSLLMTEPPVPVLYLSFVQPNCEGIRCLLPQKDRVCLKIKGPCLVSAVFSFISSYSSNNLLEISFLTPNWGPANMAVPW